MLFTMIKIDAFSLFADGLAKLTEFNACGVGATTINIPQTKLDCEVISSSPIQRVLAHIRLP